MVMNKKIDAILRGYQKRALKLFAGFLITLSIFTVNCATRNEPPPDEFAGQSYDAVGIITSIETDAGMITIDHEDIPGYMSAMEMTQNVSDQEMLKDLKSGDKVKFVIHRTGGSTNIVKLTKIGESVIIDAREIYTKNCAECHADDGSGSKRGIPFISGHALHHSEAEFIDRVNNGKGKKMPSFRDKLSEAEISAVVKFVRTEIQGGASEKKEHLH